MNLKLLKQDLNKDIEKVLSKLNIECEVFGDNIYSICPAHENSDNPRAFSFSKEKNIWQCWTRGCHEYYKNDIFGLIRGCLSKKSGKELTFSDTLTWIKDNFYTHKKYTNVITLEQPEDELAHIIKTFQTEQPLEHKEINVEQIKIPSEYFIHRGFQKETLIHFGVGDCNDPSSKMYNRAIIPIHNDDGSKIIATIGRSMKEYRLPKFLIYPKGLSKSNILYNLHRAKEHIQDHSLIIAEGQGDVWRLYEAGIKNAVSIFGKSLSKNQIEKLHKLPVTKIIVLTDNDQAGKEAKVQIKRDLGRMYSLIFPRIHTKDIGEMTIEQVQNNILPQLKELRV